MNKNIWLLGATSFLTDLSSEMIMPLLPLFLSSLGGGGMLIGIIGGLGDSIASLFKVFSGYMSDKTGKRKLYVFFGYSLSSFAKLLFAFASSAWDFVLLRPLERFGKGIRTAPRDAIIAESTIKEKRGKGFGIHRALDNFGAVVGSIIALLLVTTYTFTFQSVFLVAAIVSFTALIPLMWIKEKHIKPKRYTSIKIGFSKLSDNLKLFIFVSSLFALANFTYMFYILRAQDVVGVQFGIAMPMVLYIIMNVTETIFSTPAGMLSDKIGRVNVLLIGYGVFAIMSLGFFIVSSFILLIPLFVVYGIALSFVDATERALVSDLAHKDYRATAIGTYHTATGLAMLPAGMIAGALWQFVSPDATFIYSASVSFIAFIMLLFSGIEN